MIGYRISMATSKKDLLVTLDEAYLDKASTVVAKLKKAGLTHVRYLKSVGVVSGQAPSSKIETLKKIRGVAAVEESARIQLEPPDAPVQ
jgi:methylmalonyl-CoA mutase cobalamin-binding subunit